jgi:ubiquinone/menaquinone biosynthesis C-methylase UbiE
MATVYDAAMKKIEAACFSAWRAELLCDLGGDILEIGSGTGINLGYYPRNVKRLLLTEPDPHMRARLTEKTQEKNGWDIHISEVPAHELRVPSGSIDHVVSTLVLCSVASPENTLSEIARVLKPGGKLHFMEHVVAKDRPAIRRWQKLLQPAWKCISGNCHLARDTEQHIIDSGLSIASIDRSYSTGGPVIVSPTIRGVAHRS